MPGGGVEGGPDKRERPVVSNLPLYCGGAANGSADLSSLSVFGVGSRYKNMAKSKGKE